MKLLNLYIFIDTKGTFKLKVENKFTWLKKEKDRQTNYSTPNKTLKFKTKIYKSNMVTRVEG